MKKTLIFSLLIGCLLSFSSCEKETPNSSKFNLLDYCTTTQGSINWDNHTISKVGPNTWIYFYNELSFDTIILKYADCEDSIRSLKNKLRIRSMSDIYNADQLDSLDIYDDFLAAILNSDGIVQIGDYLFEVIFGEDSVRILEISTSNVTKVSNNYDFWGQKEIEATDVNMSKSRYSAEGENRTGDAKFKLSYQNAVFYHSIVSKINKPGVISLGSTPYIYHGITSGNHYTINERNATAQSIMPFFDGGGKSSYLKKPYKGRKGLKKFNVYALYQIDNLSGLDPEQYSLHIEKR